MLGDALRPLTDAPRRGAVLCDIDGTLAPIVERAEQARVPPEATRILAELANRYVLVGCISGRSAADARRLVGVGRVAYAGAHGAELWWPGDRSPTPLSEYARYAEDVHEFVASHDGEPLRGLGVRVEDKGPIVALHWRGVADEDAAEARLRDVAAEADRSGLATHWGRKVLELRPPVPISKGRAVQELVHQPQVRAALYGGDDTTDLDAFDALDAAVRVGVVSDEGPPEIARRADVTVQGPPGFLKVLHAL